ncbi:MAG: hypothetical protein J6D52_06615 [Clostridia bacterium]|nr:hypothetical protein [Clostridia bacterium]
MCKEKKQYLSSYLLQEAKINRLKIMIENNPENKLLYIEEIENAKKLRKTIEEKINSMDDKLLSELLFQKYVLGHNLSDVSYQINYSKRQTERFHRKALEKFVM